MSRRVRRRVLRGVEQEEVDCWPRIDENLAWVEEEMPDWISLPRDVVVQIFSLLNLRDRAQLSSTCRTWRGVGKCPWLWQVLDLRPHRCDAAAASLLAPLCIDLWRLRFHGPQSVNSILKLRAKNLREMTGDSCRKMTDTTFLLLVSRHETLERLQIDSDFNGNISSHAVKMLAECCPRLQKLWLSSIREVDADAINALAMNCQNLMDIGFINCWRVDVTALGNVASLRYFSVAGTVNMNWDLMVQQLRKLSHLIGLDVSRTEISPNIVSNLFSSLRSLEVLCALDCPAIEGNAAHVCYKNNNNNHKDKVLLAVFTHILHGVAKRFLDPLNKYTKFDEISNWLERVISNSVLRISKRNSLRLDAFWHVQGNELLLGFMKSTQEEVQEWAAAALATLANINPEKAEAGIRDAGGVPILLDLAWSAQEGIQLEATRAIANLSVNPKVAKSLADEGVVTILSNLAWSFNRLVAKEAARGLQNLCVSKEHKGGISKAGGIKALVNLIYKWSGCADSEGVLESAACTLANLATDNTCIIEIAFSGGLHSLVMLACNCKFEQVQKQVARALANFAAFEDGNNSDHAFLRQKAGAIDALVLLAFEDGNNSDHAFLRQKAGAIDALVLLIRSPHNVVRNIVVGALWSSSFLNTNLEAIVAAGGVRVLVALARSCSNASSDLKEKIARALWRFSEFEAHSFTIGHGGVIASLLTFIRSEVKVSLFENINKPSSMEELALAGTSAEGPSKLRNCSHSRSGSFEMQVEIERFITMLRNPCSTLRLCTTFTLLQFSIPGSDHHAPAHAKECSDYINVA